MNHGLLTALVEHFHLEIDTFHLPQGEMMVAPKDIYRILCIPFHGPWVMYDTMPQVGIEALRAIFQVDLIMGQAITWDELIHTYGPTHRLPMVLGIFISCFLVVDRGQHELECRWG